MGPYRTVRESPREVEVGDNSSEVEDNRSEVEWLKGGEGTVWCDGKVLRH